MTIKTISIFLGVCVLLTGFAVSKREFGKPVVKGEVSDALLTEVSGIAASIGNEGYLWVHNDSGDLPQLYLLDSLGQLRKVFSLKGAFIFDWEDMAVCKDKDGVARIYIGDIGDNFGFLRYRNIYRLKEPSLQDHPEIKEFETMTIQYEDGPRDAETLMVDPATGNVVIVTKREKSVHVYESPFIASDTVTLKKKGVLNFTQIVAGDISRDGKGLLLKNYKQVFYWDLSKKGLRSLWEDQPMWVASYIAEPQGEAICWDADGSGFYTLSEYGSKKSAVLYYYPGQ